MIKKRNNYVTVENCKEFCSYYNFAYAGVENGNECFCGQTLPTKSIPVSECDKKCKGDNTQTCGGGWAINVYAISKKGQCT